MTQSLSPAAQAVSDAAFTLADLLNREVSQDEMIAAALRALADQVVPREQSPALMKSPDLERLCQPQRARAEILAIAAELEAQ